MTAAAAPCCHQRHDGSVSRDPRLPAVPRLAAHAGRRVPREAGRSDDPGRLLGRADPPADWAETEGASAAIGGWLDAFRAGALLFDGTSGGPGEGAETLALDLKADLLSAATAVAHHLPPNTLPLETEEIAFDVAQLVRQAHTRERYVALMIEFAQKADRVRYRDLLPAAGEGVRRARMFVDHWPRDGQPDEMWVSKLQRETRTLPGLFRGQAHDINMLFARLRGELTPLSLDFTDEEGGRLGRRCDPAAPGRLLEGVRLRPPGRDALGGLRDRPAGRGGDLGGRGFQPYEALPWRSSGWLPHRARRAVDAGYKTPEEAARR